MQKQKHSDNSNETDKLKCTAMHELETTKRKAHANKLHRVSQQQQQPAQLSEVPPAEPAILSDRANIALALSLLYSRSLALQIAKKSCTQTHTHKHRHAAGVHF